MSRALKLLHTVGAIGVLGSLACMIVLLNFAQTPDAADARAYAHTRVAMGHIADWVFMPALAITLVAGLLAIAGNRVFQNAGWVWVKLASGILVFEASLVAVHGPVSREADLSAKLLANAAEVSALGQSLDSESMALWIMVVVSMANVILGVYRPRIGKL